MTQNYYFTHRRKQTALFFLGLSCMAIVGLPLFGVAGNAGQVIENFIRNNHATDSFRLTIENDVFALVGDKKTLKSNSAFRYPENDFVQDVVLYKNRYFISEVKDKKNNSLFIYGTDFKSEKFKQVSTVRKFSLMDAIPYYFTLYAKDKTIFTNALSMYGIDARKSRIKKIGKALFYLIGNEEKGLLMDSLFRPVRIKTVVYLNQIKTNYEIRFDAAHSEKKYFPVKISHHISGKKIMVSRVSVDFNAYKALSRTKFFTINP